MSAKIVTLKELLKEKALVRDELSVGNWVSARHGVGENFVRLKDALGIVDVFVRDLRNDLDKELKDYRKAHKRCVKDGEAYIACQVEGKIIVANEVLKRLDARLGEAE